MQQHNFIHGLIFDNNHPINEHRYRTNMSFSSRQYDMIQGKVKSEVYKTANFLQGAFNCSLLNNIELAGPFSARRLGLAKFHVLQR